MGECLKADYQVPIYFIPLTEDDRKPEVTDTKKKLERIVPADEAQTGIETLRRTFVFLMSLNYFS